MFEDVLSGLPTSEQPYIHELRRVPPELAVLDLREFPAYTGQTGPPRVFGADRFDDRRAF